jgi:hypothetical protein
VDAFSEIEPQKLDSNWITHLNLDNRILTKENIEWIRKYRRGEPYNEEPCWEYIINGNVKILGRAVRKEAYNIIKLKIPTSRSFGII